MGFLSPKPANLHLTLPYCAYGCNFLVFLNYYLGTSYCVWLFWSLTSFKLFQFWIQCKVNVEKILFIERPIYKKQDNHRGESKCTLMLPDCLYLPSQPANSLKVTRFLRSWSNSVKVRFASVSACWFEPPGHGTSSPYRLLNWGLSSRYCLSM